MTRVAETGRKRMQSTPRLDRSHRRGRRHVAMRFSVRVAPLGIGANAVDPAVPVPIFGVIPRPEGAVVALPCRSVVDCVDGAVRVGLKEAGVVLPARERHARKTRTEFGTATQRCCSSVLVSGLWLSAGSE